MTMSGISISRRAVLAAALATGIFSAGGVAGASAQGEHDLREIAVEYHQTGCIRYIGRDTVGRHEGTGGCLTRRRGGSGCRLLGHRRTSRNDDQNCEHDRDQGSAHNVTTLREPAFRRSVGRSPCTLG